MYDILEIKWFICKFLFHLSEPAAILYDPKVRVKTWEIGFMGLIKGNSPEHICFTKGLISIILNWGNLRPKGRKQSM